MRLIRLSLLLLAAGCATPNAIAPQVQPSTASAVRDEPRALLWEIARAEAPDRPLYLTGSIHLGRPDQLAFPPSVEAAFARSKVLVVELDPDMVAPMQAQGLVVRLGLAMPPAAELSASVAPETKALLPDALARVGLPLEAVEVMRPWFLAMTLSMMELQKAGYSEKGGLDLQLLKRARGQKAVLQLETMESQLRVFADQPLSVQDLWLRDTIRAAPLMAVQLASMASAWEGGNPDALADLMFSSMKDPGYAPLYEALFTTRNRAMAEKVAALLDEPEIHFVAVGAGHVVGAEGIPSLLEKKGFKVRQMPRAAP
ncbi:MAG: TraB/GumN family protein [Deltaproteobacteria bacterium]|nr:TraB/GumN family protein [Deltaproteobacteria bacterium]